MYPDLCIQSTDTACGGGGVAGTGTGWGGTGDVCVFVGAWVGEGCVREGGAATGAEAWCPTGFREYEGLLTTETWDSSGSNSGFTWCR